MKLKFVTQSAIFLATQFRKLGLPALILTACLACASLSGVNAQDTNAIRFQFTKERVNDSLVWLKIKALIRPGIRLYAIQEGPGDSIGSSARFDTPARQLLKDRIFTNNLSRREWDSTLGVTVGYFTDSVQWQQAAIVPAEDSVVIKGTISYLYKAMDEYRSGEEKFKYFIQPQKSETVLPGREGGVEHKSLIWVFLAAFGSGLLALITPCVYSMIPVTVSFFTRRSRTRAQGIRNAILYASSIITIFTLLGFLVTLVFGPAALNNLATNWIANLVFFVLFLVFGISFLGAFDFTLPASWTNSSDARAGTGGFPGIFFMALTLVLVSFSCTGPIIGNLLVLAARGNYWSPLTGMFGFSLAMALPFALFAFFPSKLNVLGRAGGWLNAVKVTLGFVELALALKFLSNADLVKGWRLLDREVFISLWIVIFVLLGIYLLGKLKFHHDDELPKNDFGIPHLSVKRLFVAMASLSFAVYLVPGLWGAPLKAVSAFLPPMGTQDFVALPSRDINAGPDAANHRLPQPVKYYEQMKMYEPQVVTNYGLVIYFDFEEALEVARTVKKPLLLDFTGINCVNCRKMEGQVWSDPGVLKQLKEDFVIVSLYVDAQGVELQEHEQYYSKALGRTIETLGDRNADFQVTHYGANSQPYYFFVDGDGRKLVDQGYGYDPDVRRFVKLLETVKKEFAERTSPGDHQSKVENR